MWDRFTEPARLAIYQAQQAAIEEGDPFVGPDHLMLGLIADSKSEASQQLERIGVPPANIRALVSKEAAETKPAVEDLKLTSSGKRCIDRAYDVSRRLHHDWIGPEHLLAGILENAEKQKDHRFREANLTCARVLEDIAHGGGIWPPPPTQTIVPHTPPEAQKSGCAPTSFAMAFALFSVNTTFGSSGLSAFSQMSVMQILCFAAFWFAWQARHSQLGYAALIAIFIAGWTQVTLCVGVYEMLFGHG
ncbi:MAG: Clp protease N-terminal domain-containing protein [Capsulimonas sp.]|uniref:Clp protease N-terminal domain-containing protein n=1 Tax=Capsulimonas sp. TaxID=2494211 RepID=UPI0032642E12